MIDPNVPITERLGRAIIGAIDAAVSIPGGALKAAKAADAAVDVASRGQGDRCRESSPRGQDAHVQDAAKLAEKPAVAVSGDAVRSTDRVLGKPLSPIERENAWLEGKQAGQKAIDKAHEAVASQDPLQIRDAALGMQESKHGMYQANRLQGTKAAETRVELKKEMQKVCDATDKKSVRS